MKFNISFLIMLFLLSCQPKDLPTVIIQKQDYALVKLSHQTTQEELETIQQKLATQDIGFNFDGSKFFEDSKLQTLVLFVTTPEGSIGRTNADIVALQFRYFGFLYQKDGSPVFKIGEI